MAAAGRCCRDNTIPIPALRAVQSQKRKLRHRGRLSTNHMPAVLAGPELALEIESIECVLQSHCLRIADRRQGHGGASRRTDRTGHAERCFVQSPRSARARAAARLGACGRFSGGGSDLVVQMAQRLLTAALIGLAAGGNGPGSLVFDNSNYPACCETPMPGVGPFIYLPSSHSAS